jgi:predicted GIY-YIG superfamily endonuclease
MNYIKKILREQLIDLFEQKKWNEDAISKEASNYNSKTEFARKSPGAYDAAKRLGIFDLVTSHMETKQIKWTKDMIEKEAKKYRTKSEFVKNSPKAADRARYHKIWDEVTKDMDIIGDAFKRLVYVYEFPDKVAYVGLTHDKAERDAQHRLSGRIADYIKKTGLQPNLKIISDDYINASDAQNLENCTIELYKKNGWVLLNKGKAGSLGMCRVMWTKERVKLEISKYETKLQESCSFLL